ncbi:ricin B lectin domain-containing protein [Mycena galericulata]|nr:ricin B lectin domain-containing protein [Mycena galericulata]
MLSVFVVSALWTASAVLGHPHPDLVQRQTATLNQYIHPGLDSSKCLTAASATNGAAVEIEDCIPGGSESQEWAVGSTIWAFGGTFCLDVTNGNAVDGTPMQLWECTQGDTNQEWTVSGKTIQWTDTSFCLDLTNGDTTNGNVVQIWGCTDGPNQQWTTTTGTTAPPNIAIRPGASATTCLTAPQNVDGGKVVVQPCDASPGQIWQTDGQTLSVWGDYCLDVTNGNTANGVPLQIWSCTPGQGDANQHFTISGTAIQWANTDQCLDLTNGNLTSGNPVQTWECIGDNTNQVWHFAAAVESG